MLQRRWIVLGMVLVGLCGISWAQEKEPPKSESPASEKSPKEETTPKVKKTSASYGFSGKEMLELAPKAEDLLDDDASWEEDLGEDELGALGPMKILDCDGDGRNDILFVSLSDQKYHVFYRKENHKGFERKSYELEEEYRDYAIGDINRDGRPDLVLAVPNKKEKRQYKVHVILGKADRKFSDAQESNLEVKSLSNLEILELSAANPAVLVLKDEKDFLLTSWDAEGVFHEPVRYANPTAKSAVDFLDVDGDGRRDLILAGRRHDEMDLAVRLQLPDGAFGPELSTQLEDLYPLGMDDVDGDGRAELVCRHEKTKMLKVYRFLTPEASVKAREKKKPERFNFGTPRITAFDRLAAGEEKSLGLGDIDNDGRTDLVLTDGAHARLLVYLQSKQGALEREVTFSTFSGASRVAVADLIGDKKNEVVILSSTEKVIGISPTGGKKLIAFPKAIKTPYTPTAFVLGDFNGDGRAEMLYASVDEDPGEGQEEVGYLTRMADDGKGQLIAGKPIQLDKKDGTFVKSIRTADLNGDGRLDFITFYDYSNHPGIFIQQKDRTFENVVLRQGFPKGLIKKLRPENLSLGDVDGDGADEMVLHEKTYAKVLKLGADGNLERTDQYSGKEPDSQIGGLVIADLDRDGAVELLMRDSKADGLSILAQKKDEGLKVTKTLELSKIQPEHTRVADLDNDGKNDIVVLARNKIAILYADRPDPTLESIYTFRTKIKDGVYTTYAVGDVNGDKKADLVMVDGAKHHVEILSVHGEKKELVQELTFLTFRGGQDDENGSRRFRFQEGGRGISYQPRSILVEDMNGDGKKDVVIRLHKNVIIYTQE